MRRTPYVFALAAAMVLAACGEPTDRPEDCNGDEFFDEGNQLCTACPVIDPPDCRPRFGFVIVADEQTACPAAQCSQTPQCAEFEIFEDSTASCQPACALGFTVASSGACVACAQPTQPECASGERVCTSRSDTDGCPELSCATSCD